MQAVSTTSVALTLKQAISSGTAIDTLHWRYNMQKSLVHQQLKLIMLKQLHEAGYTLHNSWLPSVRPQPSSCAVNAIAVQQEEEAGISSTSGSFN